jgi:2-dehydro-3-deoxygluconokinase
VTAARLLTVGEAMLRLTPTLQLPFIENSQLDVSVGGAELNVAVAARCMGLEASWMSRLPRGILSEKITRHARSNGVDPVISYGEGRVGIYFAEVAVDPRGVTVTYDRDYSAAQSMGRAEFASLIDVNQFTAVFSSGITLALGESPRELVTSLFEQKHSWRRYFEINYRSKLATTSDMKLWVSDILPNVDVLFASTHDLTELLELGDDLQTAVQKAISTYQLEYVVVADRRGKVDGVGINTVRVFGENLDAFHEFQGRVVDPIGAGDAGAGVFVACIEQGLAPDQAAQYAVIASAWTQTHAGDAATFQRSDLIDLDDRRIRR